MLGAHGGMHQKWHNAYEETIHVPFVVHSPLLGTTPRDVNALTNHADLLPTMLGLAGIDEAQAASQLVADHTEVRALVGRDLSALVLGTAEEEPSDPVLFMTDDEISEGNARPGSPFQRWARRVGTYDAIVQPNHVETVVTRTDVDGETHTVKLSRYHDNQQFWAMPGELDVRLQGRKRLKLTEPSPDEYELYDLTTDPLEQHNLAHSSVAQQNGELLSRMVGLLAQELAAKRLVPSVDETPGYRPPVVP
jgi:arylsulfatase A-like enzyme